MALELTEEQVKAGWTVQKLGDLCTAVISGGTPNRKNANYYAKFGEGIPWVKTQEIRDGRIYATEEFITELGLAESSAKIVPAGAILIAMYGATVGRIGRLVEPMTTNQAACSLVVDPDKAIADYIYYVLFAVRDSLIDLANGAAQQNLNLSTIRNFEIALPPRDEQEYIAEILVSLDDKIEANNALIDSLSELAIAEIERLGIFSGETDGVLEDIIEFSPKVSKPVGDSYQFIDMSVLPTSGPVAGQTQVKDKWTGSKFVEGDTLFSRITPCLENGKTAIAMGLGSEPAVGSTEFIVMRARGLNRELLSYGIARSRSFREIATQKMTGTSGRQRVKWQDLAVIPVSTTRLNEFSLGSAEFDLLRSLRQENIDLANTRDLLIQNLIGR